MKKRLLVVAVCMTTHPSESYILHSSEIRDI